MMDVNGCLTLAFSIISTGHQHILHITNLMYNFTYKFINCWRRKRCRNSHLHGQTYSCNYEFYNHWPGI